MSVLTQAQFKALYGSTGTLFPDNTTGEISEADMRSFGEDIADTFALSIQQTITVDVSSAEILALFTTPKQLIPAPGAGKLIELISVVIFYDYITAAYTDTGILQIRYNGSSAVNMTLGNSFFIATTDVCIYYPASLNGSVTGNDARNLSMVLFQTTANPSGGSGTLKIKLTYVIHTMP